MRLHTNHNLMSAITEAAEVAGAEVFDLVSNDSRSHDYGFTVKLTGDAPNRPNGWSRDKDGDVRAASWDQWGVFFSVLFDRDPEMVVGGVANPVYNGVHDFDRQTNGRFARHLTIDNGRHLPAKGNFVYVPHDMHNRHVWDYQGESFQGGVFRCRKCTAAKMVRR